MTKILYLPTGEYLTFMTYNNNIFTTKFENLNIESYPSICKLLAVASDEDDTSPIAQICYLCSQEPGNNNFVQRQNLIMPVIKEHFEVIEE